MQCCTHELHRYKIRHDEVGTVRNIGVALGILEFLDGYKIATVLRPTVHNIVEKSCK